MTFHLSTSAIVLLSVCFSLPTIGLILSIWDGITEKDWSGVERALAPFAAVAGFILFAIIFG